MSREGGAGAYGVRATEQERTKIHAHCSPYGIVASVEDWFHRLAEAAAGSAPPLYAPSESLTEFLARFLQDLEQASSGMLSSLPTPEPRSTWQEKVTDLLHWLTHLRPPREIRFAEETFGLLGGSAGTTSVQVVYEVDHPKRLIVIRKVLQLPGPPPSDDER